MSSTLSYSMFKGCLNNTNITFTIQLFRPQLQDNLSSDIKPSIGKVVHELQNLTYNLQPIIAQSLLFSCAVQYFSWVEDLIALSQLPLIASGSSGLAAFKASGSVVSQLICVGWLGRPPRPTIGWMAGVVALSQAAHWPGAADHYVRRRSDSCVRDSHLLLQAAWGPHDADIPWVPPRLLYSLGIRVIKLCSQTWVKLIKPWHY